MLIHFIPAFETKWCSIILRQYYILKSYELLQCGDVEKLIKKRKSPEHPQVYYATIEDTYDIISKPHIAIGHSGCDSQPLWPIAM